MSFYCLLYFEGVIPVGITGLVDLEVILALLQLITILAEVFHLSGLIDHLISEGAVPAFLSLALRPHIAVGLGSCGEVLPSQKSSDLFSGIPTRPDLLF